MKILNAYDKPIEYQLKVLKKIIKKNKILMEILTVLEKLDIDDCFVAAGAINQTVFNYLHGYEIDKNINDYDIVYFDSDSSYEKEDIVIKKIENALLHLNVKIDIKNQARVHLWYGKKFGHEIQANKSVYNAINKWGTTVTCIGVRLKNNKLIVYAPFGLNDLFKMIIRPNKENYIKRDYDEKAKRWKNNWPKLTIIPWDL